MCVQLENLFRPIVTNTSSFHGLGETRQGKMPFLDMLNASLEF